MNNKTIAIRFVQAVLGMAFAASSLAAVTDIATGPLVTSTATPVLPNLLVMMDDSGSMDSDYMPDKINATNTYGRASAQCNGVYYDPRIKYLPPVHADGTSYDDSKFNEAWMNGFDPSSKTVDLSKYFALGLTTNAAPPTAGVPAYYYLYKGSQTQPEQRRFYDSPASTFWSECTTRAGSGNSVFTKVVVGSNTGLLPGEPDERTNFANWFSYYRTRVNMMKSGMGLAFMPVGDHYRVGFATMNNNNDKMFLNIADFNTDQKKSFYDILYSVTPGGTTPLLGALTRAGRLYAKKIDTLNNVTTSDPVQYSCQKNYTLLSTDGFWNDQNNSNVAGDAQVGNTDAGMGRPFSDGGTGTVTTVTPSTTTTVVTKPRYMTRQGTLTITTTTTTTRTRTNIYDKIVSAPNSSGVCKTTTTRGKAVETETTTSSSAQLTSRRQVTTYLDKETTTQKNTRTVVKTNGVVTSDNNPITTPPSTVATTDTVGTTEVSDTPIGSPTVTGTGPTSSVSGASFQATANSSAPVNCAANATQGTTYRLVSQQGNPSNYGAPQSSTQTTEGTFTQVTGSPFYTTGTPTTAPAVVLVDTQNTTTTATGGVENTLADVAMYYYMTDLRTPDLQNCFSTASGTSVNVCKNNVSGSDPDNANWQHMTTFTLGLGAPGKMIFTENYLTATSGDYYSVKTGELAAPAQKKCSWGVAGQPCNWPAPSNDQPETIDDLWHAAINGRGDYFSATTPTSLAVGLANALASVGGKTASSSPATVSNPNVTATDNSIFSSTFQPGSWEGDLRRRHLDPATGLIDTTNLAGDWTAADQLDTRTSRTIYTYSANSAGKIKLFTWANLTATEKGYFSLANARATLGQFCAVGSTCLSSTDQAAAIGTSTASPLFEFIRGDRSNEGTSLETTKYFRKRTHVLGDIVNSAPTYVQKPLHNYGDAGYSNYITANNSRAGVVYVGSNDGMLHAFDGATGAERWAYVPSFVMPNLYKLADKNYSDRHQFFVDATPTVEDVYYDSAWHTILVGGLNAGGRGYYALDVTNPASPTVLWEFTDPNLGLTYGNPKMTKLSDGTWVVLVTSGYNNVNPGDGQGHLWVLNPKTGVIIRTMSTGVGSTTAPSGLARISVWADFPDVNATGLNAYGGDLLGNVWRFDINSNATPQLMAVLKDPSGAPQPVTTKPELGRFSNYKIVYVGTGKFLGVSDRSTTQQQTFYAIKDDPAAATIDNPRANGNHFVRQALTSAACPPGTPAGICGSGEAVRTGSSNTVNFATDNGWYIDLPITGERANTNPTLVLGTIGFNTNVPDTDPCSAGGSSYAYFFDYRNGAPVAGAGGVVSVKLGDALASDTQYYGVSDNSVGADNNLSDDTNKFFKPPIGSAAGGVRRVTWRELTTEK